jgi:hypothetical protein
MGLQISIWALEMVTKAAKMDPRTARKSENDTHRADMRPRVRFRCQKGGPGYEKLVHFGTKNGPKIKENMYENMAGFRTRFHGPFLRIFAQNGARIEPLRPENGSQNGIESKKRVFNSN